MWVAALSTAVHYSKATLIRILFLAAILLKGIDGIVETIAGIFLICTRKAEVNHFLRFLANQELQLDPDNPVAHHVIWLSHHFSFSTKTFSAIYLCAHGLIKLFLVVNLWRDRNWVYPTAMAALSAFIGYQVYRLCHQFSWTLVFLTTVDMVIVGLIWVEYRHRKARSFGLDKSH